MKQHIQTLQSNSYSCGIAIFQSCLKDTVTKVHILIYKTKEAVMNNIKSGLHKPSKYMVNKLFIKDNFVFLNDVNRGVHILDYTNPTQPITVFIDIPGNVDMAVRGNILYVDCFTSLIALDIFKCSENNYFKWCFSS